MCQWHLRGSINARPNLEKWISEERIEGTHPASSQITTCVQTLATDQQDRWWEVRLASPAASHLGFIFAAKAKVTGPSRKTLG